VGFFFLLFSFLSLSVFAHEIQSLSQYIHIRKQNDIGRQQELIAKMNINRKFDFGLQATYLERFSFFEKRGGVSVSYRPNHKWNVDIRYLHGVGNKILPQHQSILSTYYSLSKGLTPFFIFRDSKYSTTDLNTLNAGIEIELIPHMIFIPMLMGGKATFTSLSKTQDVHNYGMRAIYSLEQKFAFSLFGFKGKEASQGVIGQSTFLIETLSGGASMAYFFIPKMRTELIFDHTDYKEIKTQFYTTTLNLTWIF
jgi:hypothetical protein